MATRRRRDTKLREYRFKIDAYTPKTIPLIRLTAYLRELAVLFGNTDDVHLDRIAEGSTEPILLVEREAEVKVRERLQVVRANDGPEDAMRAHKNINEMLREDDGKAAIIDPVRKKILVFQGRDLNKLLEYGPFTQPGTLEGQLIKIGGEGEWVPVHLQNSLGEVHWCWAKRGLAREIARYIFGPVIRVEGTARWLRQRDGEWDMVSFRAKEFSVLDSEATLRQSITHLREIPAKWKELDDPLGELKKIRHGT
jgi:hypothetical protein